MEFVWICFVPDAVNPAPETLEYSSMTPVVFTLAKPVNPEPLSARRTRISLSVAGLISTGPPVNVKDVLFDVPVIGGRSRVTVFPTTEY